MKKNALRNILLAVSILGLITACPSCATAKDTEKGAAESVSTTDVDGKGPTGLPNGMIDRPQIWIDGTLYYYHFDGEIYLLPEDFEKIGTILEVNDFTVPDKDFCAASGGLGLTSGQEIWASEDHPDQVYIQCSDDGFYPFLQDA